MAEIITDDPLEPKNGLTLTPFHLLTLLSASICLLLSLFPLPPPLSTFVAMSKRATFLLVCLMLGHFVVTRQLEKWKHDWDKARVAEKRTMYDPLVKSKIEKKPNDWENANAHPSHFLTTRDGKPRLFPFPLGMAGGADSTKKNLWWEAGNSAHVGHYNQREAPEAREQLRLEMEGKEAARQSKAKKALKEYETNRKKWQKRLTHLKVISAIVIIGICAFHRKLAVICLAGLIYYIFAMEFKAMVEVKRDEEEKPAKKRKKIPTTPGMAMTYLYEPADGGLKEHMAVPTKAPSHRLMTTFDNRYAS